jgi:hypothetical protein
MPRLTLEQRVAILEQQVAELRTTRANGSRKKDWRRTIGMFTGDEVMKRIDEEAHKLREAGRRKARRSQAKSRQA